jgi:hypothetical protein
MCGNKETRLKMGFLLGNLKILRKRVQGRNSRRDACPTPFEEACSGYAGGGKLTFTGENVTLSWR